MGFNFSLSIVVGLFQLASPISSFAQTGATSCSTDPRAAEQRQHSKIKTCAATKFLNLTATVRIAIIDTGVDNTNVDLRSRVVSYINTSNSTSPYDIHGHGTNVAALAAAARNNNSNGFGSSLSSGTRIISVKALDDNGNAGLDRVINGVSEAVNAGADVMNLSIWCPSELAGCQNSAFAAALTGAVDSGIVVVKIAGNGGVPVAAGTDNSAIGQKAGGILVANQSAVTGALAPSSGYSNQYVDIAAPGSDGVCADIPVMSGYSHTAGRNWNCLSGTSMAAPLVAGAAANVIAYYRQYNRIIYPAQVEAFIAPALTRDEMGTYRPLATKIRNGRELDLQALSNRLPAASCQYGRCTLTSDRALPGSTQPIELLPNQKNYLSK